ncbi:MAG: hypothetical protein WCL30_03895 [Pseudomonadota bacterium]
MSEVLEDEFVNRSEWLSPAEIKKYAEFAVKSGRKIYHNGLILPSLTDKMPIERLADDEGVIEPQHRDAGIAFKILCDCANGRSGEVINSEAPQSIDPVLKLVAITNQMQERDLYIINHILFEPVENDDYRFFRGNKGLIQYAFENLTEAMKNDNIAISLLQLQKKEIDKKTGGVNV